MNYSRTPEGSPDTSIIDSWHKNALPWTQAVRARAIESRRLVTDAAIIATLHDHLSATGSPSVVDVGCGEGWLLRALAQQSGGARLTLTGFDAIPALIEQACAAGGATYQVSSYDDLAAGRVAIVADALVCNFSLLGRDPVDALIRSMPSLLSARGVFIVQTLHPLVACGTSTYEDGWRQSTWDGFGEQFTDPAPWYFRTLGSWLQLLRSAGLRLLEMREPLHPHTGKPASVIWVADVPR
jgi:2-polyprenyl-3-methyl-5-hydroxy-6-metoxy-1,4-benzoquinol methylase